MNKKLVTSLKLSQILEKLKVKQKSHFSWFYYMAHTVKNRFGKKRLEKRYEILPTHTEFYDNPPKKVASAFLSGELGEMLPIGYGSNCVYTNYYDNEWRTIYLDEGASTKKKCIAKTEAEARGKMLVYLIKNKLIEI